MKWFDIIKLNSAQEASIQAARRKNISAAQRKEYENVSPAPDLTELSNEQAPSAPDLEMEQIRAKLKEAQQSNNPRNIKIYTNKLNALMDKKVLKPNPQALQEARDKAAKPNQPQSEESEEKPKLTLPNEKPPHLSDEQWEKMKQDWNKRKRSIYG